MTDPFATPALEQARLVRDGRLSSEELVTAHLARIDRRNPDLQAFVQVTAGAARLAARFKDSERRLGRSLPPFHGVPIGIKDLDFARGTFTRMGSRAFRWLWSPMDNAAVARLRAAGFVIVGKTSTSELGAMPVTEPDIHPPARNPWRRDVTPGGSSGGSAAAVAAGLVPIALGSDGAGSIRIPSAFCGVYGFKPSRDGVPNPYGRVDRSAIAYVGPIARTVDDAAAFLDALRGDRGGGWRETSRRAPPPQRIRVTTTCSLCATEPEVHEAVQSVARALETLGHRVDEGPALGGTLDEFLPIWQRQVADVPVVREAWLQPVTRWLREAGRHLNGDDVRRLRDDLRARVAAWYGDTDLWLTPVSPVFPPAVGAWRDLSPEAAFREAACLGPFTAPFNLGGQPAASIPAAVSRDGLPIGVQLAGRPGNDATVLAVSRQLEEALPWAGRRPPA